MFSVVRAMLGSNTNAKSQIHEYIAVPISACVSVQINLYNAYFFNLCSHQYMCLNKGPKHIVLSILVVIDLVLRYIIFQFVVSGLYHVYDPGMALSIA